MKTGTVDVNSMAHIDSASPKRKAGTTLGHYSRFAGMVITSSLIMYGVMFLNTYVYEHVHWSTTRVYMTLMMTATMSVVMLAYMHTMLDNRRANSAIFLGSAMIFAVSLLFARNQVFVNDQSWMKAMIPHHSIAILTSERAGIEDIRVKALSARIIDTQAREIKEMEWLMRDIKENGIVRTEADAASRPVP